VAIYPLVLLTYTVLLLVYSVEVVHPVVIISPSALTVPCTVLSSTVNPVVTVVYHVLVVCLVVVCYWYLFFGAG
jgi:hypothetical protein